MRKLDLVLTLDYELFGNGSGDVFKHLVIPTNNLLKICHIYNIKLTIFFEVIEYLKIKEEWNKGNTMGYNNNPVLAIENQIIKAFQDGHDIQLHIHPQWINAKYNMINGWQVSNKWSMNDFPAFGKKNENNLYSIITNAKKTLENLLRPYDNKYNCTIFRAGGFNILPSEKTFPVLKQAGFKVDSSVFAGGYDINEYAFIDFRSIQNIIPYWVVNDKNVNNQRQTFNNREIIEFPVFSRPQIRILKYDFHRVKNLFINKKSAIESLNNRTATQNWLHKIRFFFEKEYLTWDYCLFNYKKMKIFFNAALKMAGLSPYEFHPFILIGHSKGFFYSKSFEKFLSNYSKRINFLTLSDAYNKVIEVESEQKKIN